MTKMTRSCLLSPERAGTMRKIFRAFFLRCTENTPFHVVGERRSCRPIKIRWEDIAVFLSKYPGRAHMERSSMRQEYIDLYACRLLMRLASGRPAFHSSKFFLSYPMSVKHIFPKASS